MATIHDASWPPNKSHHVGQPRTHFENPWPSFRPLRPLNLLKTRFGTNRNFVPVPQDRSELVRVREPDWGSAIDPQHAKLKATWIGHASWLVETPAVVGTTAHEPTTSDANEQPAGASKGVRILLDPVFAERTSPFSFVGPKRYTPTPCLISELPEVDIVCISHNHYDHLDSMTIKELAARSEKTHFLCGLGVKEFFVGQGIKPSRVTECDWWQGVECHVKSVGSMRLVCTPSQHNSARSWNDTGKTLWCSWAMGSLHQTSPTLDKDAAVRDDDVSIHLVDLPRETGSATGDFLQQPSLYFAGDTGYRAVTVPNPTPEEIAGSPHCPAFSTIGKLLGPFDLALLPIGLCLPRDCMSSVHCCPEDAVGVAKDIQAKKSIGMHYGTVRGGISEQYEDVREPPRWWREECDKAGLKWGEEAGLCDVGETVAN